MPDRHWPTFTMAVFDENKALLITWTCYGTWLPGDDRGSVSNKVNEYSAYERKQNQVGELPLAGDERTRGFARSHQKWDTEELTVDDAACVAQSLCTLADERNWTIHRAAIMRHHVHAVVANCPDDGPMVRRVLKGVTQADVCRERGQSQKLWTQRGSDRYLNGAEAIEAAIQYVAEQAYKFAEVIDGIPYCCVPIVERLTTKPKRKG
jgi:REP element-mobilizing transposase RayT